MNYNSVWQVHHIRITISVYGNLLPRMSADVKYHFPRATIDNDEQVRSELLVLPMIEWLLTMTHAKISQITIDAEI